MLGSAHENLHQFIQRTKAKPLTADITKLAVSIVNHYMRGNLSAKKLKKLGSVAVFDRTTGKRVSAAFRFDDLVSHIRDNRSFYHTAFNLPPLHSIWLDATPVISIDSPIYVTDRQGPLPFVALPFGESFPVKPSIDREGVALGTFQPALQGNIVKLFTEIIDTSHLALELGDLEWFHRLRMLINDCVTIVDITLHQLYYKAEYDPKPGWKFDRKAISKDSDLRIMNKFEWIGKITGRGLDDAVEEKERFRLLKNVRNHMNHFDPPCFAFTLKDATEWLSHVQHIGRLLWKMRMKMGEPPSSGIVEMITLPMVEFVPRNSSTSPPAQGPDVGYSSSQWPTK